ncbi:hypothetical protein [Streptomyces sp. RTd22]|uniref:hypothetical protein n=1 Tax=Streptomyces sp. RTd22 TaxID=1841249 RepID=UPI00131CEB34|nr:hypothetical protein [Streptomyces sp. RTd22]
MKYEPLGSFSVAEAEGRFTSGHPHAIAETLISAALHASDSAWVEKRIVQFADHGDLGIRRAAALALGHLARNHGCVGDAAVAAVEALTDDAALSGAAQDALEDVEIFTRPK